MDYKLNKTDGSLLVELVDGRLDISSADIALIGKNYQGFGESINENFIKVKVLLTLELYVMRA